jgi:hypothetical protein
MRVRCVVVALACLALGAAAQAQVLVPTGASWKFLDDGSDQGSAWRASGFADAAWSSGPAELGYGDGDEATLVRCSSDPVCNSADPNKFITTYFRHHFNVADPGSVGGLTLRIKRDDGAVVYLNGTEAVRSNMPSGAVGYQTLGLDSGGTEDSFFSYSVNPALLVSGDNVLAVEVHQWDAGSSDLSFDLDLEATAPAPASLERPPYLQVGTPTSVIVRWRTDTATGSTVRWGSAPGSLGNSASVPGNTTEHEVPVTGLSPGTTYYYSVGSASETLAGGDADHWFTTSPTVGAATPIRIWVTGDSGACSDPFEPTGCDDALAVKDAYLAFAGSQVARVWLMLGDNAYNSGTDAEFTTALFDIYPDVLRNTVLWPVPGNHEFGVSDSPTQSGPYYDSFTMPTAGEAGGVPSGTEAYYSFDVGNVHFVALDSHDTDRSTGGLMYSWLEADLMATDQDWLIVYWHHPPYTKGGHDSDNPSDSGGRMTDMRERFVPLIEAYGVDLQLTGHSHSYERSMLIDGHYGLSSTFNPSVHAVDSGDGDPAGDGAYEKAGPGLVPHEGAVYSVVGSSSRNDGSLSLHPVMVRAIDFEGSMVIDVDGEQLDATWIDKSGNVGDHFRIAKGGVPGGPACSDGLDNDGDGLVDYPDDPGCADASWELENPQCDDDLDNDGDGKIDWDGGAGAATPDPQCGNSWRDREQKRSSGCGLGGGGLALALLVLRRRRGPGPAPTGSASRS